MSTIDHTYRERIENVVSRGLGMDRQNVEYSPDPYTNLHAHLFAMDIAVGNIAPDEEREGLAAIAKGIDYYELLADRFLRDPVTWVWEMGDRIIIENER